ncbi:lipolytic enzyme [Coprinopsis marcescibilis]|uniref:Lipolytic enzyme n=1 Tax=Coprinopsis marcescibilis TaxID=230819 RepID=A0A5C3KF46_COPMA|nr:lipolytic enzyme [Coprinopsis marcescibilis]
MAYKRWTSLFVAALSSTLALAQVPNYGQCGGSGWTGSTQCVSGSACVVVNQWYSQCQPGAVTPVPPVISTTSVPPTTPTPTPLPPPQQGPIVTLPLGDSITFGMGTNDGNAYRKYLKDRLRQDGIEVDYIGTVKAGNMEDNDCQGHSGATIDQISGYANTPLAQKPQVVLLKAGTNDMAQNRDINNAPNRLITLVDKIFTASPNATVLVASLVPLSFGQANVDRYNTQVKTLVDGKASQGQHVVFVSMSAVTTGDLADGVHPNANGYNKMAQAWYAGWISAKQKGWIP